MRARVIKTGWGMARQKGPALGKEQRRLPEVPSHGGCVKWWAGWPA